MTCPVCDATRSRTTVTRDRLPTMQNAVHRTREGARAARDGRFALAVCEVCGFGWNEAFEPARLEYDDSYDNAVPSAVMDRYYEEIARTLGERYGLEQGYVVDIGCGNGKFLSVLARIWPGVRGLGVDPALPADSTLADGRIRLVKGVFSDELLTAEPSLFVSRHVLEHIPSPVPFVAELRRALGTRVGVPLFVEVPDLGWILRHDAFWDFCYEHCNYFTEDSLRLALTRAGFSVTRTELAFGAQYRWIEAVSAAVASDGSPTPQDALHPVAAACVAYAGEERARVTGIRARLQTLKAEGASVAVWGMATKGVMFTLLVDPDATIVDVAVDVNTNKQGCFVPLSGRLIESPSALRRLAGRRLAVVVMNPNYAAEIRERCLAEGVQAELMSAAGEPV